MRRRLALAAAVIFCGGCVVFDASTPDAQVHRPDAAAPTWPRGFDPPADCAAVLGVSLDALFDADVVRIATLLPESGAAGDAGRAMRQAVALALEELETIGGLPDGRRVAALACDTRSEPERAFDLTGWLVTDYRPPAIIGPGLSAATFLLDSGGLLTRGPLYVSPSATHPDLATLDDDDRFWRTAPADDRPARALGRWMGARAQRVAVVGRTDRFGEALSAAALAGVCGGPCPLDRAPRIGLDPEDAPGAALAALRAADADGWILLGSPGETIALLELLEEVDWPAALGLGEALADPGVVGALPPLIREATVGARHGVAAARPAQDFAARYSARWGTEPGPFAAHAYDATWMVLHAIGALPPGTPVDGFTIAARFERMSSGEAVPSGPGGWAAGQAAFRDPRAGTFDFDGASGPLDFDARGEVTAPVRGWSVGPDGTIEDTGIWLDTDGTWRGP